MPEQTPTTPGRPRPFHHFRETEHIADSEGQRYVVTGVTHSWLAADAPMYQITPVSGSGPDGTGQMLEFDCETLHDGRFMRTEGGPTFIPPEQPLGSCTDERGHMSIGWTGWETCEICGVDMGFCTTTARWYDEGNVPRDTSAVIEVDSDDCPFY